MSSRDEVLSAVREAIGHRGEDAARRIAVQGRIAYPPDHTRPSLPDDTLALFRAKANAASVSLEDVGSLDAVPEAVVANLSRRGLEGVLRVSEPLARLHWPATAPVTNGAAAADDRIGVVEAFAGIAETGSLAFVSGPGHPTTQNFVPEHQIAVLRLEHLLRHQEELWARLRETRNDNPRTVNIVTGPSRTADVDQQVAIGVHGPKSLHCLLVAS